MRRSTIFGAGGMALLAAVLATPARAVTPTASFGGPELIEKLREGGYVVAIRHMATEEQPRRPGGVDLTDCNTQRVLSEEGRKQAEELGRAFRKLGIVVSGIVVSPYCRTVQTATAAFGELTLRTRSDVLTVWDGLPQPERERRAVALREMLAKPPRPAGTNTLLVTHSGNFGWGLALASGSEGVAHVFAPGQAGPRYLGAIQPDEWRKIAGLEASRPQGPEILRDLAQGGYVILMRHAATERRSEHPEGIDLANCATQRVLSDEGKGQAETMAETVHELGIPIGDVLVSPYCRCVDTGRLAFGKATVVDWLAVWDTIPMDERVERGKRLRKLLNTPPAPGTNNVLVTHSGVLIWTLGLATEPEGLAHVFQPSDVGRAIHVGAIRPANWNLKGTPPAR